MSGSGLIATKPTACQVCWWAKDAGASPLFSPRDQDEVKDDVQELLYRSPHLCGLNCSRCSQERLRQTVPWMRRLSLPGISKLLRRLGVSYQRGRVHITSPDPLYQHKMEAIAEARMLSMWMPKRFVFLYEDEHTYGRQPSAAQVYGKRGGPTPRAVQAPRYWTKRRIAGCLNVHTGALITRERSRFNVREMAEFFLLVEKQYPEAERIFIALDNWPVHFHGYVLDTLREHHSRITLLPLPTYAPWTNPIEKVWRQFNQDLFHHHPWSDDWPRLRQEVACWLARHVHPSEDLLRYVGLASLTDQLPYAL
jgi:transposase